MQTFMNNATISAMRRFMLLFAHDITEVADDPEAEVFVKAGRGVLEVCERIDVGFDDAADEVMERLRLNDADVWFELIEDGFVYAKHVGMVLAHFGRGGTPGSPFEVELLRAMEQATDEELDAATLSFPELVGLFRAGQADLDRLAGHG